MSRGGSRCFGVGAGPPGLTADDADMIVKGAFVFNRVWKAFGRLRLEHKDCAWAMLRNLYGVAIEPYDRLIQPVEVHHGRAPGPFWIWREFPQLGNSQLVSVHPINGSPSFIMDFAIPGSSRPKMTMLESRLPPGFDPSR